MAAVSSSNVWAVGGQRLCTFRFNQELNSYRKHTWKLTVGTISDYSQRIWMGLQFDKYEVSTEQ